MHSIKGLVAVGVRVHVGCGYESACWLLGVGFWELDFIMAMFSVRSGTKPMALCDITKMLTCVKQASKTQSRVASHDFLTC